MGRKYPDEFKQMLKDKATILDVVSQFVQIQQNGNAFVAICPFHNDTDPSMQIRPDLNTFGCWACGAGSKHHSSVQSCDVFGFLKGVLNCNLGEAIEWLATFLHQPLPALTPEDQKKATLRQAWVDHCKQAADRFTESLMNHKVAYNYLYHRGLNLHDILSWGLGFGDDKDTDFTNTRDRIVFSLHDYYGDLVSFTGRVLLPDEELNRINQERKSRGEREIPKYQDRFPIKKEDPYFQNHPYPEFDKRNHLYGIHLAKTYIKDWRTAIVVEGWTDAIMLHKCGARHAVSTMGVALTDAQMELIKRSGAKYVITMRDGDKAGLDAAERDCKIIEQHGLIPMIVPLDNKLDPFDLCKAYLDGMDAEGMLKYIDRNKRTYKQWLIQKVFNETQEGIMYHHSEIAYLQNMRMQKVIEILSAVMVPVEQDTYLRQASELFNVSYEALQAQVNHYAIQKKHLVS
ncbi:toprim domain-containing protein (plasmid) [Paenibacillus rhizovicinus]|uniref:Toprim domain-containing protein n=1 Tax=Paenibacillus rhizovicinus TaxID=2704463 RepID=A0A6C0PB56_9BACL|nr:CHC2 zinc finger domain-containing protein [Paenibacillus rhizovicinus]QHW35777.1 toprim domain-containing protein [Paenibacillus rhizovicinus]